MQTTKSLILFVLTCAVVLVICGTASTVLAASSERVLYNFSCCNTDGGASPVFANPILDSAGNIYGTTTSGGDHGQGVVYELTQNNGQWTEKVLHSFGIGTDGRSPHAGVIFDAAGNLYGTTGRGGIYGYGTVFELLPSNGQWTEKVLHNFGSGSDGRRPWAGVVFDPAGNLYGTTLYGGTHGDGTVYELSPANSGWTEKVLHSFNPTTKDALLPLFGLTLDSFGNLYGTASGGTGSCLPHGCGAVFELAHGTNGKWAESVLHSFDSSSCCIYPAGNVVLDKSGNLYLNVTEGGADGWGAVVELIFSNGTWTENVLHSFAGTPSDGAYPNNGLTFDSVGNLYGTTLNGGTNYAGTVFELVLNNGNWTEKVLHSFSGPPDDGRFPYANVILDGSGSLYSTTYSGGSTVFGGTVFEVTP